MNKRTDLDPAGTTRPETGLKSAPRDVVRLWAQTLRRHQLHVIAAWLLEATRPFAVLSAQLLFAGSPFLGPGAHRLAHLLESDEEVEEFIRFLDSASSERERLRS